jgi:hypothetical protein
MRKGILTLVSLLFVIAACSSLKSTPLLPNQGGSMDEAHGLVYYMPRKDFKMTLTVKDGTVETINLTETAAYPDLVHQYSLRHAYNGLGKNTLDVGVGTNGLLTSSKATTKSGVSDAFKNLASSLGGFAPLEGPEDAACAEDGTYTYIFEPLSPPQVPCVNVAVAPLFAANAGVSHNKSANEAHSGIFYRQARPYVVEVSNDQGQKLASALLLSPSDAVVSFMPVSRTLFADNEAEFTFIDGMPTKYKQDADGEFVALLKLPADVIKAYFAAVGATFDAFKSTDQKNVAALDQALALELAERKYKACLAAIQANDDDLIKELEC